MGIFKNKDQKEVKKANKAKCLHCRKGGTNCARCKNLVRGEGTCCCGKNVSKW